MRRFLTLLVIGAAANLPAQTSIRPVADRQQWFLSAGEPTYVAGFNDQQMPQTLYWELAPSSTQRLPAAKMSPERVLRRPDEHDDAGVPGIGR